MVAVARPLLCVLALPWVSLQAGGGLRRAFRSQRPCIGLSRCGVQVDSAWRPGGSADPQDITVLPLGHNGHSREELMDVANVAMQGFFVHCYDASKRTFVPDSHDQKELSRQVFEDLADRYGPHMYGRSTLLVARGTNDAVVGCIGLEVMQADQLPVSPDAMKSPHFARPRKMAYMSNLAVLDSVRRQGIGRRLILEAEQRVREAFGLSEVTLVVNAENQRARRLYEKHGYRLAFEDTWGVRATPVKGGELFRARVLNVGYAHKL